ncbi:hypothetical protein [Mucilaginibacter antarcticus]|uniref:hypothetical protein n=1 Tax=Mucilaginibacter antarcticus TaxID=1855725 RepID=UPI003627258E
MLDNNVETKFLVGKGFVTVDPWKFPLVCIFTFLTPQKIRIYAIGSANDSQDRDPKEWTLEGSNDEGATWTMMDSRLMAKNFYDQAVDLGYPEPNKGRYKRLFYYTIANPIEYKKVRWTIKSNWGADLLQLSEFQLFR